MRLGKEQQFGVLRIRTMIEFPMLALLLFGESLDPNHLSVVILHLPFGYLQEGPPISAIRLSLLNRKGGGGGPTDSGSCGDWCPQPQCT